MGVWIHSFFSLADVFEEKSSVHGVENRLIQNLLANYSRWGRPIADVSKPVQVSITFYLTQLMSLVRVGKHSTIL